MSKRRINKQQAARVEKIQQAYQQKEQNNKHLTNGLVITRYSRHVEIEDNEGERIHCSIRPNLGILVAGDQIIWQPEGDHQGVVVSLYPRKSLLARHTNTGIKKPVAANITQIILVIAPRPEISWPLLDSYLIMAETLSLQTVILLNKTDLPCEELKTQLLTDYQPLNYPIIFANKTDNAGLEQLKRKLDNQISVFVGQSGVGKSSLISGILPHESNIAISEISITTELGRHTTSNSRYYHLPSGGALIDSPGVREFSLCDIEASTIAHGYIEFRPFLLKCRYRNCSHIETPDCAIIDAVRRKDISPRRYEQFIKLSTQYSKPKY